MVKNNLGYIPVEWEVKKRGGSLMITVSKYIYDRLKLKEGDIIIVQILDIKRKSEQ